MREYALYKGEEVIAIGTIGEIARKTGVKRETVAFYKTPTYKKRIKNRKRSRRARILIDLGPEEEEK